MVQTIAKPMSLVELHQKVANEEIVAANLRSGRKIRFFICSNNRLCAFRPRSSRTGTVLFQHDVDNVADYIYKKQKCDLDKEFDRYKLIRKYQRYAEKGDLTSSFVEKCRQLPGSFEQWQMEGSKSLYDYRITTGVRNEGQVITVKAISDAYRKYCGYDIAEKIYLREDISFSRFKFRGYEASVSGKHDDEGHYHGYLSMEFIGCGNGHYYLLINNDSFIYYDKD